MTPSTHAILTVNGHFNGQAPLDDAFHMESIKADARKAREEGKAVTLRKGPKNLKPTAICGCCGSTVRLITGDDWQDIAECSCGAREGSSNTLRNTVYSWMSPAQQEEANDWYDAQMFGFDGGF
jgi:hypothetical protein